LLAYLLKMVDNPYGNNGPVNPYHGNNARRSTHIQKQVEKSASDQTMASTLRNVVDIDY